MEIFENPFRPGAGQKPPYLAGRNKEQDEFRSHIKQFPILKNLIYTGLRGVGKTVLLDTLKPVAINEGWLWAGTDLSESAGISESNLSIRVMTDISTLIAGFSIKNSGIDSEIKQEIIYGSYEYLEQVYNSTPGLEADKLKNVLETVWEIVKSKVKGIVLAYDEAQILKDKAKEKQFPLSLLLEVIQFLQRKEIPILLVLTGLPTLYPHLIEARTYAERMFHVVTLDKLNIEESREAITKPIVMQNCPVTFTELAISEIIKFSEGYPYFIQFICKETFDSYIQQIKIGITEPQVTIAEIIRKLDTDFYSGRWSKLTQRQQDILKIIANLQLDEEFSVIEIVANSKHIIGSEPFSSSHSNQILTKLTDIGIIFKNRHGKYSFAVPLMPNFIKRQN